jgi:hypothetical protein
MSPETKLPWKWLPDEGQFIVQDETMKIVAEVPCQGCEAADGAYLVHAANEYPKLVAALRKINDTIYSVGAPLGSDRYFDIRGAACNALRDAGENIT